MNLDQIFCLLLKRLTTKPFLLFMKKLRLLLPDGTILAGWADTEFHINPEQFYWAAQRRGLVG